VLYLINTLILETEKDLMIEILDTLIASLINIWERKRKDKGE